MNATPVVYASGVLRFYASGTSTPQNVYSGSDLTGASTTITLNSAGRPSQDIFLSILLYKVTLEDSLGNIIWTVDPYMTSDYTTAAKVTGYSGNPNTHIAGTASAGAVPADMVWDRTNNVLYVCTTTGNAAAAVWTVANVTGLSTWTTAGRNVSPTAGVDFGYNTTLNSLEYWNASAWVQASGSPRGYIDGLTLSNDSGSPNTVIDIAAGLCRSSDDTVDIKLTAITKTTGAFATGTGNGGLDTGAVANNTWYFAYAIYNPTTLAADGLFSVSSSAPTMPSGYTKKRYLGAFKTASGSTNILTFVQSGDDFLWKASIAEITNTAPGDTAAHTLTLTGVPTGFKVIAKLTAVFSVANSAGYLSSLDQNDEAPSGTAAPGYNYGTNVGTSMGSAGILLVRTNTSAQVRYRVGTNSAQTIVTLGWADQRGKNA